jgi:hypothetical protein
MEQVNEYKIITGSSTAEFQRELAGVAADGYKPILLTSASLGNSSVVIAAIVERSGI